MVSVNQVVLLLLIVSMAAAILYRGLSFSSTVAVEQSSNPWGAGNIIHGLRSKVFIKKPEEGDGNDNEKQISTDRPIDDTKSLSNMEQIKVEDDGIRITRIHKHDDAILVENGCYQQEGNKIILFTNNETDSAMFFEKTPISRNLRMHVKWERQNTSEWKTWLAKSGGIASDRNVLFFLDGEQPAHCMHDFLFSAFLVDPQGLKFDEYLTRSNPGKPCQPDNNWCCFVFTRARVIVPEQVAPFKSPFTCYSRLWVLMFGRGRFAADWDIVDPKMKSHLFSHGKGMYPLKNLQNLQHELLHYDNRITMKRKYAQKSTRTNILVLDRTEAKRRIWQNAKTFVSMLANRWSELSTEKLGSVVFYGASFSELSPLDQARLFHNADVIISPHGAQLSNIIFGERGRTCLIEVLCNNANDYSFSEFDQTSLEWNGNYPLRLGMRVWRYSGPNLDHEKCYHDIRTFSVDLDGLFASLKKSNIFMEKLSASSEP